MAAKSVAEWPCFSASRLLVAEQGPPICHVVASEGRVASRRGALPRHGWPRQPDATAADHGHDCPACVMRSRLRPPAQETTPRGSQDAAHRPSRACPDAQGKRHQQLEPWIGQLLEHSHRLGSSFCAGRRDAGQARPHLVGDDRTPATAAAAPPCALAPDRRRRRSRSRTHRCPLDGLRKHHRLLLPMKSGTCRAPLPRPNAGPQRPSLSVRGLRGYRRRTHRDDDRALHPPPAYVCRPAPRGKP